MNRSEMTSKERLKAALRGDPVDRIPWSPFLVWWWENQNEIVQAMGQPGFLRHLGADALLRGFASICKSSPIYAVMHTDAYDYSLPFADDRCALKQREVKDQIEYEFVTPVGSLHMTAKHSHNTLVPLPIEYPVKKAGDNGKPAFTNAV